MHIDWTFPVWNIIIAITFLGSILYKMGSMETKINAMWEVFMGDAKQGRREYDKALVKR